MAENLAPIPLLRRGDPAHRFHARALNGSQNYNFDLAAGRHLLLLFFGSAAEPASVAALQLVAANRSLFDDVSACFFGITTNPADETNQRIAQSLPGIRFFLDYDRRVSALYGAAPGTVSGSHINRPHWVLLCPQLRVLATYELDEGVSALAHLSSVKGAEGRSQWAPVLSLPNVFEPELCQKLIQLYEQNGGQQSGFMRDEDGKTVLKIDPTHKIRSDFRITDMELRKSLVHRIHDRIIPEIQRAFQFNATRIERYIVACYDANDGGHFRPHRDNTTRGTAHRRFAVTINLNADDYEGGNLRFPEFGPSTYRASTGGAIIFSCSLLHEATPVTKGRRYAFLPFLYDDAAAAIREANNRFLGDDVGVYQVQKTNSTQSANF